MKRIVLFLAFSIILSFPTFSQSYDIGVYTGVGVASTTLDGKPDYIQEETHTIFNSIEINGNYRFRSDKKLKPFIGTGVKYYNSEFYRSIEALELGYNLNEVDFSQQHLTTPIRAGLDVALFGNNTFGFLAEYQYNFAMSSESRQNGQGNGEVFGSLDYRYSLTSRTESFGSYLFSVYFKTQVSSKLYLISSAEYIAQPVSGTFDYITDQIQTFTDQNTGMQNQVMSSLESSNNKTENNFYLFKVGIVRQM